VPMAGWVLCSSSPHSACWWQVAPLRRGCARAEPGDGGAQGGGAGAGGGRLLSHLGQVSGRPRLAIRTLSRRSSSRRRRRRESWPSTSRSDSRTSDDPVIDREYHSAGCQQELREETARQREAHAEAGRKLASVEAAEEEVRKAGAKAVQSLMAEFQVLRAEAEEARKTTEQQVLACGEGRSRAFFHGVAA